MNRLLLTMMVAVAPEAGPAFASLVQENNNKNDQESEKNDHLKDSSKND